MPYYPQLATGNVAQYPAVKRHRTRTIANEAVEGSLVSLADTAAEEIQWELSYSGLSQTEREVLDGFFTAREGRLETFVFPDPLGNLLALSDDPAVAPWQRDPLVQFTAGASDPMGTSHAIHVVNAGGAAQAFRQSIDVPGSYRCCFSFWAKGAGAVFAMKRAGIGRSMVAENTWQRFEFTSAPGGTAPSVFSVELGPGAVMDIYGLQVEPQEAAGGYRRTAGAGDVYPQARFDMDESVWVAEGVDSFSTTVKIRSAAAR
ncbi:MAG: hypothetical protein U0Q16_11670 [Bryobacteraceae bacterium]